MSYEHNYTTVHTAHKFQDVFQLFFIFSSNFRCEVILPSFLFLMAVIKLQNDHTCAVCSVMAVLVCWFVGHVIWLKKHYRVKYLRTDCVVHFIFWDRKLRNSMNMNLSNLYSHFSSNFSVNTALLSLQLIVCMD